MAPVSQGYFPYTALVDGSVDLCDVYRCLDSIKVNSENERRIAKAREAYSKNK